MCNCNNKIVGGCGACERVSVEGEGQRFSVSVAWVPRVADAGKEAVAGSSVFDRAVDPSIVVLSAWVGLRVAILSGMLEGQGVTVAELVGLGVALCVKTKIGGKSVGLKGQVLGKLLFWIVVYAVVSLAVFSMKSAFGNA